MSLTLFLPRLDRTMEPEHEREREREFEHGKEERSRISHSIGMRKERKVVVNFPEEFDTPGLLSI